MLVGLVPKLGQAPARALAQELCGWLSARGHEPRVEEQPGLEGLPLMPGPALAASCDLLVVLGGDGTLLHAASLCAGREVPILGINLGTLGFLTEMAPSRAVEMLEKALAGQLEPGRRSMLKVEVRRGGDPLFSGLALNDVVVSKNALSRLARMEATVDGRFAAHYEADGVIVATPTGSTAYSLSAGGPIVYPFLDVILITPICPHTLTQRPLLLPARSVVGLQLANDVEMFVTLDGARGRPLSGGEEVLISPAPGATVLLRNPEVDPFAVLRQKMRWGQR